MSFGLSLPLVLSLLSSFPAAAPAQADSPPHTSALASMTWKLRYVETNGKLGRPDSAPTEFTEEEVNAYLASGELKLPAGVKSVHLEGQVGVVTGTARVNFDEVRSGNNSSNPLLSVFTGTHLVIVTAHAHGEGGQGIVQVDSVLLDGVPIPRFLLQLFAEKYLQPKHPEIGLDSQFALPDKIAVAVVGSHRLTVVQK